MVLTHEDLQHQHDLVLVRANALRLLAKFPPKESAERGKERVICAAHELRAAREEYRHMAREFAASGVTKGTLDGAMQAIDPSIARKLDGHDAEFRTLAPDYNGGEIDWFAEASSLPQLSAEEQKKFDAKVAALREKHAQFPPTGWGSSITPDERLTRWRTRPLNDRLNDLRPRDISLTKESE